MRADLSRDTFDPAHGYQSVVLQMGRALLDADFNEQGSVLRYLARETTRDVVGPDGAPRGGDGFAVSVSVDGGDLLLSPGRLYVDGLVVDNQPQATAATATAADRLALETLVLDEAPLVAGDRLRVGDGPAAVVVVQQADPDEVVLTGPHGLATGAVTRVVREVALGRQPFVARPLPAVGGGSAAAGRHVVVLRVRVIEESALDRPSMAEVALGGPDTTVRLRLVWQVLLARVGPVGSGGVGDWRPPERSARLRPSLREPDPAVGDCALPADAAYRGTEHRLYRVEINGVDEVTGVITSLLHDRDNAHVASVVSEMGQTVTLESFGARGAGGVDGFDSGQVATLTDRRREWDGASGQVVTTSDADPARRRLTLSAQPDADLLLRPRLRRWSGQVQALAAGQVVDLGDGLEVQITGRARVGDYWLIPARSAFGADGTLDWPRDADDRFRSLPAHGPDEAWAALAVVDFDGATFTVVSDHRTVFPPLTAITAVDVSYDNSTVDLGAPTVQRAIEDLAGRGAGRCTIDVAPGPGWEQALDLVPDGLDARLCFRAGVYPSAHRVTLRGKGSVLLEGLGPATVISASDDEVALSIEECSFVSVRDMAFTAAGRGRGDGLSGALTVVGATRTEITGVTASCASGADPRGTCLTVVGPSTARGPMLGRSVSTRAIIRDCLLLPGEYQIGLLVRDVERSDVTDVVVEPPAVTAFLKFTALPRVLTDRLKAALAADIQVVAPPAPPVPPVPPAPPGPPVPPGPVVRAAQTRRTIRTITSGQIQFAAPGRIAQPWRDALTLAPVTAATTAEARTHLARIVDQAFRPNAPAKLRPLRDAVDTLLAGRRPVVAQGIVVTGRRATEVRITGCRVSGVLKGVQVALSDRKQARGTRSSVGRVVVTDNRIDVYVPPEWTAGRHGVYVGHASSVLLADNVVTLDDATVNPPVDSAALRLGGFFGADVVVRHNDLVGFSRGLWFRPNAVLDAAGAAVPATRRWLVSGNLYEDTAKAVHFEPVGFPPAPVPALLGSDNVP